MDCFQPQFGFQRIVSRIFAAIFRAARVDVLAVTHSAVAAALHPVITAAGHRAGGGAGPGRRARGGCPGRGRFGRVGRETQGQNNYHRNTDR